MAETEIPHPPIVSRDQWRAQRIAHLANEKELTRQYDRLTAERRRLPMVKIDKEYAFDGPDGRQDLRALFGDARQLIVYHFMFDPTWEKGCTGCTGFVDSLGNLDGLKDRDTRFILISRAPWEKLDGYRALRGWSIPWYSSFGSDFNYDFHVSHDPAIGVSEYNYRPEPDYKGEAHGLSVFFRIGDDVFHTYSTFGRGVESIVDTYRLLDLTPYGRQEDFEDSPAGWPQRPTYG